MITIASSKSSARAGCAPIWRSAATSTWSQAKNVTATPARPVALAELAESKENVRSALNRAIHKSGRNIATASDADFRVLNAGNSSVNHEIQKIATNDLQKGETIGVPGATIAAKS